MKILVAPDKFKGTLTAAEVSAAMVAGITAHGDHTVKAIPLADGGDGTASILTAATGGRTIETTARDPLYREIQATYGLSGDGTTAFIEMAQASGLHRLKPGERNCYQTSSVGTGDLILHAAQQGARKIYLGIGGSATNDGGIGMAHALGWRFLDREGYPLLPIGASLNHISVISSERVPPWVHDLEVILLVDVDNPLVGPEGATFTYGRQKGGSEEDLTKLEQGLARLAWLVAGQFNIDMNLAGHGAGGGLAGGATVFLNTEMKSGIDVVLDLTGMRAAVQQADLVITGEGKLDEQSLHGKVVVGVIRLARQFGKPVWCICGVNELSGAQWHGMGIDQLATLVSAEVSEGQALLEGRRIIAQRVREMLEQHQAG